jgi:hypothetical protein
MALHAPFEVFQVDSVLPNLKEACVEIGSLAIMLELNWQAKSNATDRGTPGTPFCFTPDNVCISQAAQSIMPTAVECGISTGNGLVNSDWGHTSKGPIALGLLTWIEKYEVIVYSGA